MNSSILNTVQNLIEEVKEDETESLQTLHLTSYENRMSKLAESFLASPLSYRYNFSSNADSVLVTGSGLMLKGLPGVYELEEAAKKASREMFHATVPFFRPTSGLSATLCTVTTVSNPGDTIYSIDPDDGGHFATKHLAERCGRVSRYIPWDSKNLTIDMDAFAKMIKKYPPDMILFEHGTPLFNLPVKEVRKLVGDDVTIVYDGAHTLGLIAGGFFQDPLREGANMLQGNTHKTFPGPEKGMIFFRDLQFGESIVSSILSGIISNSHAHHLICLSITMLELYQFGKAYAAQMIKNGKVLAESLAAEGFDVVNKNGVFTTSHEVLIDGDSIGSNYEAAKKLFASGFSVNARKAFRRDIIRLGTEETTRRGMKENEMKEIAHLFRRIIIDKEAPENVKKDVISLNESFPNIHYSFDKEFGLWKGNEKTSVDRKSLDNAMRSGILKG
jgi:glycine/serine hydroxymethyltransferase